MNFEYECQMFLGRQNEYRDKKFAMAIAEKTGGELVDEEYKDCYGSYWIVIWRD